MLAYLHDDVVESVLRRLEAVARVREVAPDISCLPRELRVDAALAVGRGRKLRERDRREIELFSYWLKEGLKQWKI